MGDLHPLAGSVGSHLAVVVEVEQPQHPLDTEQLQLLSVQLSMRTSAQLSMRSSAILSMTEFAV